MSRTPRKLSTNKINHIVIRGVNKQDIFLDKQDKEKFIKEILNTKEKYNYELYAYILMPNHVHLIIYDKEENLPTIMNSLQTRYVSYFNKKYERIGHLFQDKYFSKPIKDVSYFFNAIKYIHQNPEKAFISSKENYNWSSYNSYIRRDNALVNIEKALKIIDKDPKVAIRKFIEYHKVDNENKLYDYIDYELQNKLTDEQLKEALEEKLNMDNIQNIQRYNKSAIKDLLKDIIGIEHISINQLSRVTGLSRRILTK